MQTGTWLKRSFWLFLILSVCTPGVEGQSRPTSAPQNDPQSAPERPEIAGRRIVKHFDFDETRFNNYSDLPMYWQRHEGPGFPQYLEGVLDRKVGRSAMPSFRLQLNGASLAYHYEGRDISVRTNSDYMVVAWVKSASLEYARAYMTACYLDRKGLEIPGTQRRSELVGGSGALTDWSPLIIGLPGNVDGARYVGLSLWLTQSTVWDTSPRRPRAIELQDVEATAWFDDITIYRLPRVVLRSARPGNAFPRNQPVELIAEVSDPDGLNLSATLTVRDADGLLLDQRSVQIQSAEAQPVDPIIYDDLDVGFYTCDLSVSAANGTELSRRSLQFVKLAPRVSPPAETGRGFGVILREGRPDLLTGQRELLEEIRGEYVKVPVWYAKHAAVGDFQHEQAVAPYLQASIELGAEPIGIMMNEPPDDTVQAGNIQSMMDLFNEDPLGWKPLIAGAWSQYAGLIHVWQLGQDGDASVFLDDRLPRIVADLRREMGSLMADPLVGTTTSTSYTPENARVSDYTGVTLDWKVPPDDVRRHLDAFVGQNDDRTWVTVEPLPESAYPRVARLADLTRRLAETRFQNVGTVFMSAPWASRCDLLSVQVDPSENFIMFRNVADILGGTMPVSRSTIGGQAKCLVFDRNGRAILLAWDDHAPPEGYEHVLLLGEDAEQVDLWGRRQKIRSVGSQQVVRIGPVPTFIINTPTWLTEFRRQFVLDPWVLEASYDAHDREVVFRNTYQEPISGLVRLVVPPDWDIRPNRISFALQPGEESRTPVRIRFPLNAEAAVTPLLGEFDIDADRRYRIVTAAWFELGLENIDLDRYIYRRDDRVIVSQTMTNRTHEPVSFRGSLIAPGRPRVSRQFVNILPGQSVRKDFILEQANDLAGMRIRVALEELRGSRVWNAIMTVP